VVNSLARNTVYGDAVCSGGTVRTPGNIDRAVHGRASGHCATIDMRINLWHVVNHLNRNRYGKLVAVVIYQRQLYGILRICPFHGRVRQIVGVHTILRNGDVTVIGISMGCTNYGVPCGNFKDCRCAEVCVAGQSVFEHRQALHCGCGGQGAIDLGICGIVIFVLSHNLQHKRVARSTEVINLKGAGLLRNPSAGIGVNGGRKQLDTFAHASDGMAVRRKRKNNISRCCWYRINCAKAVINNAIGTYRMHSTGVRGQRVVHTTKLD